MALDRVVDNIKITLTCPQCNKHRMIRSEGYKQNFDMVELDINGQKVSVYKDICWACSRKLIKQHNPTKVDPKKILKAMTDTANESLPDKSLEEIL